MDAGGKHAAPTLSFSIHGREGKAGVSHFSNGPEGRLGIDDTDSCDESGAPARRSRSLELHVLGVDFQASTTRPTADARGFLFNVTTSRTAMSLSRMRRLRFARPLKLEEAARTAA